MSKEPYRIRGHKYRLVSSNFALGIEIYNEDEYEWQRYNPYVYWSAKAAKKDIPPGGILVNDGRYR